MSVRKDPNFAFLLAGILLMLVAGPIADEIFGAAKSLVLMVAYSAMLILGIWSLQESRKLFYVGLGLAVAIVGLTVVNSFLRETELALLAMAVLLIFEVISIYLTVEYLFSPGDISANRLMGSICAFLLIGMVFAGLYVYIYSIDPTTFSGIEQNTRADAYWDLTYFSFVTLTTLGYGDILPVGSAARALAHLEATTGTLFIAILIGLLVSSYFDASRKT